MKTFFFLMSLIIFCCSCQEEQTYYCGTEETAEKIASFMTVNMKNANNMSDEEMEDVIQKLHHTAVRIYCVKKKKKDMRPNERTFNLSY